MKIHFISGFFPENIKEDIIKNSKSNIQLAADVLQKAFYRGLNHIFPNLVVINTPLVGAFPTRYTKPTIQKDHEGNMLSIGYFNFLLIKRIFIKLKIYAALNSCIKLQNQGEPTYIIIYSIQSFFLYPVAKIKKKHPHIKIILIVPDLLENMSGYNSIAYKLYRKIESKKINTLLEKVDKFIFLSEHMANYFNVKSESYIVIEGIYDELPNIPLSPKKIKKNTILYSGGLYKKYGIPHLLDAFKLVHEKNVELIFCGSGDSVDIINRESQLDSRIRYLGIINRSELIEMQQNSTILINPRLPNQDFTMYSFPSKTMEYLASGSVLIMYQLPGVPNEYYDYFISPDNNSPENLAQCINKVLAMSETERLEIGKRSRDFILTKKNAYVQCKKILTLIEAPLTLD